MGFSGNFIGFRGGFMEVDGISWGVNDGASLVSWTFDGNLVV